MAIIPVCACKAPPPLSFSALLAFFHPSVFFPLPHAWPWVQLLFSHVAGTQYNAIRTGVWVQCISSDHQQRPSATTLTFWSCSRIGPWVEEFIKSHRLASPPAQGKECVKKFIFRCKWVSKQRMTLRVLCVHLLAVRLRYACPTWTLYLALTSTCLTKASYPALHTYKKKTYIEGCNTVLNTWCNTQWHCKKTQTQTHLLMSWNSCCCWSCW